MALYPIDDEREKQIAAAQLTSVPTPGKPRGLSPNKLGTVPSTYGRRGIATEAQQQATQADYASRGLNALGNDQTALDKLTARADMAERTRLNRDAQRQARRQANVLDARRNNALAKIQRAGFSDVAADQKAAALALQTLGAMGGQTQTAAGQYAQGNQAELDAANLGRAGLEQQERQATATNILGRDTLAQQGQQFNVGQQTEQQKIAADLALSQAGLSQRGDIAAKQYELDQQRLSQASEISAADRQSREGQATEGQIAKVFSDASNAYNDMLSSYDKTYDQAGKAAFMQRYPNAGTYASEKVQQLQSEMARQKQAKQQYDAINKRGAELEAKGLSKEEIKAMLRKEFPNG